VDTSFIKSQVGFNLGTEVKLNLQSDLNFYGGVSLCMQLVQPDAVLRYVPTYQPRRVGTLQNCIADTQCQIIKHIHVYSNLGKINMENACIEKLTHCAMQAVSRLSCLPLACVCLHDNNYKIILLFKFYSHNVHKIERIIGSKHRLRKSKYKSIVIPGRTYVLNQKNNEMCNAIFTK